MDIINKRGIKSININEQIEQLTIMLGRVESKVLYAKIIF